jgi:hypothetical protein
VPWVKKAPRDVFWDKADKVPFSPQTKQNKEVLCGDD